MVRCCVAELVSLMSCSEGGGLMFAWFDIGGLPGANYPAITAMYMLNQ